jgi:hypothetical protein
MFQVCAWCGKVLTPGDGIVSHGICRDCAENARAELRELKRARASVQDGAPASNDEIVAVSEPHEIYEPQDV